MTGKVTATMSARAAAFNNKDAVVWDGDHLAEAIALESYRSLRRYITRHVAPRADARVRKLLRHGLEERAEMVSCDERSLNAWAVALWSQDLEAHAFARHWHRRADLSVRDSDHWLSLNQDAMEMELKVKAPGGRLRTGQCEWLLGHATLAIMKHRFVRARAIALGMARARMVELDDGLIGRSNLVMSGELKDSGDLKFTVHAEAADDQLAPRAIRSKGERRCAAAELSRQRLETFRMLCAGPCLRFTWREGWCVASSTAPQLDASVIVRRNRLFVEGHPLFILFPAASGYCARMVDVTLEVLDDEPWKAIDTLRHAYTRYKRLSVDRRNQDGAR